MGLVRGVPWGTPHFGTMIPRPADLAGSNQAEELCQALPSWTRCVLLGVILGEGRQLGIGSSLPHSGVLDRRSSSSVQCLMKLVRSFFPFFLVHQGMH